MNSHLRLNNEIGRFGAPSSINRKTLLGLPPQMQTEGVLLLMEMGWTVDAAAVHLDLPAKEVRAMAAADRAPYRRGGEDVKGTEP